MSNLYNSLYLRIACGYVYDNGLHGEILQQASFSKHHYFTEIKILIFIKILGFKIINLIFSYIFLALSIYHPSLLHHNIFLFWTSISYFENSTK